MSFSPAGFSPLEAYEELMRFANKFGEVPLRLALHAAVPQSFRCDLLHLIKQNFVPEAAADSTAEADVLFSPLCAELGRGYFQFDPQVRLLLLDNLAENYDDQPRPRIERVADFLLSYVNNLHRNTSGSRDRLWLEYLETQRWIALAFINPDSAAQQLADALNEANDTQDFAARIQLGAVASSLTTPLGRYINLLNYALALQTLETEGKERAQELFGELLGEQIEVGGKTLPTVREIIEKREGNRVTEEKNEQEPTAEEVFKSTGDDFETAEEKPADEQLKASISNKPFTPRQRYANDVFISYSHSDNTPLSQNGVGWVTQFHQALQSFLSQYDLDTPRIWRDASLSMGDAFSEATYQYLRETKVFVVILSPQYIESSWCIRELEMFIRHAEETDGVLIGNRSRIFKVFKVPVNPGRMSSTILDEMLGYNFFEMENDIKFQVFDPELDTETKSNFLLKVSDVAYDIAEMLREFEVKDAPQKEVPPPQDFIYLAQPTADLYEDYYHIRHDLLQRGFRVLSAFDTELPANVEPLKQFIGEEFSRCRISIHLLGKSYGKTLEDDERSLQQLEFEIAEECALKPDFFCFVWMPIDAKSVDSRQQNFIEQVLNTSSRSVDIFQNSLEEFKAAILHTLDRKTVPIIPPKDSPQIPLVNVFGDDEDAHSVQELIQMLYEQGCKALLTSGSFQEGDMSAEILNQHLSEYDGVIIFCENASVAWLRIKLRELEKVKANRERFLSTAVFLSGKATETLSDFRTNEATIIRDIDDLQLFLRELLLNI